MSSRSAPACLKCVSFLAPVGACITSSGAVMLGGDKSSQAADIAKAIALAATIED